MIHKGYTKLDKAEYKIKLEEINSLAEQGDFAGAAKVADEVDWRHVRSARTLCMIGEIYEACRRFDESMTVLRYAYKRSSSSKTILYRLAELSIRKGDFDGAKRFSNEFEQLAPNDSSKYLLKYKLLRAQKAPLDDQIEVLQQYKEKEYTERWAYELAKLYKKNGQNEKCVSECDDMILWFSDGRYVKKALELKKTIQPLTAAQQTKYDNMLSQETENGGETKKAGKKRTSSDEKKADGPKTGTTAASAVENPEKKSASAASSNSSAKDDTTEEYGTEAVDGMTKVEQAVNAASDSEEAVESLDHTKADFDTISGRDTYQEKMPAEDGENLQSRLADGIKSVFSGIRSGEKNQKDETKDEVEDIKPRVPDLEPEAANVGSGAVVDRTPEKVPTPKIHTDTDDLDQFMNSDSDENKGGQQVDLDKLFAETGSDLANEVASGNYTMADTLEKDRPAEEKEKELPISENDRKAAKNAAGTSNLTGRETDESLGLTREFHFREEMDKAVRKAESRKQSDAPIPEPEEAARQTVLKAQGKLAPEPEKEENKDKKEDTRKILYDENKIEAEDEDLSKEELFRTFGSDQNIQKELLAEEPKKEPEQSGESLMNLSAVEVNKVEGSKDIIQHIMEEPEVFHRIPVEARKLEDNEKKALSYFASIPGVDYQVTTALADIHNNCGNKTSRSGNVIIIGRQGAGKTRLAHGLIMCVCQHLHLQAAKVATIVADDFNQKDPAKIVQKLAGGFLIIEAAGSLDDRTIDKLNQAMEFRTDDLLVILEDEKKDMRLMLSTHPEFAKKFTSQITVPVFTNDELVTFAKTYAKEHGYKLDELATLALYTMIGDNQKDSEPVTVGLVRQMVDRGIERHNRKLRFGKSEKSADGRIILKEKDFNF